jgi:N-acetylglucosamine kinase-like BadF-type ATPase
MEKIYWGVDGGGTRTRVLAADGQGRVLAFAVGGSTNFNTLAAEQVQLHLRETFEEAARQAGVAVEGVAVLGVAGVNNEADRRTFAALVAGVPGLNFSTVEVHNDTVTALIGGLGGKEGAVLIAGTGSNCLGRREDGRTWQAGGLESLIDDGGSGFDLARQAIVAATRAADRRGPATTLQARVFEALRVASAGEVPRRLHFEGPDGPGRPMTKGQIAALAPLVFEEAPRDPVAAAILERGAEELGLMVETVLRELAFPGAVPVCLVGGVAQNPRMRAALEESLARRRVEARLQLPELPPAAGAVLLACGAAGLAPDEGRARRLAETLAGRA